MIEEWRDVNGYEGLYQVSNTGKVRSLTKGSRITDKSGLLKLSALNSGYCQVSLYDRNHKKRKVTVHRLVAETFIPNPNNLPAINHIDEDKLNNNVDNLEWCSYTYNNRYGTAKLRSRLTRGIPVEMLLRDGTSIAKFRSASFIEEVLGYNQINIRSVCKGITQTAYGYKWRYISIEEYNYTP